MSMFRFLVLKKPIISRLVCGARHALSTSTSDLSTISAWQDQFTSDAVDTMDDFDDDSDFYVNLVDDNIMCLHGLHHLFHGLHHVLTGAGILHRHASTLMPPNSRNYGIPFSYNRHKDFTDMSLLLDKDNNDELLALKKGPPVIDPDSINPEKEVWVMRAFDDEWKPPAPPCELLGTANYKIYEELWRLATNNVQLQTRNRRKIKSVETYYPILSKTVTSMIAAEKSGSKGDEGSRLKRLEDYAEALEYFGLAIQRAFDNACGRTAIAIFLGSLQEVCKKGLDISGKMSDVKLNVHSIGGSASNGFFNINYAHRSWKMAKTVKCDLDAEYRKPDVWSETNHSPNVDTWGFSWRVPDVVGAFVSRNPSPFKELGVNKERGWLAAEVKSDSEVTPQKWTKGLIQAEIQAMMGLVFHDHSAAILVSPVKAAFMAFDIHQDGFITRKKKTYTLGDGHKHMFADAFVELYQDLLGYTWDRYYA